MDILELYRRNKSSRRLIKGVKKNYARLPYDRSLTANQEKEIKQYFHDLIKVDVPVDWHRYFYRRTGVYSVKYIPTSLYYNDIIGRVNQMKFERAYSDKNLTDSLLSGVKMPVTVVKNMNGHYYVDGRLVSKAEALERCWEVDNVIIKPSLEKHGDGVCKFSCKGGVTSLDGKKIDQLFESYGPNFIVQQVVRQHKDMGALNPSSVNTIRILTYHSADEVLVPYSVVRIGRKGYDIDNETAGGISTKINPDGTLGKYAYGSPGNDMIELTDTGVRLEGYQIPSFAQAVELVKKLHLQLPHFDLIGWDICIDEQGDPVLIEWNVWPELSQSANGPAFGDYTEQILKEIWNRPNTRYC